VEDN